MVIKPSLATKITSQIIKKDTTLTAVAKPPTEPTKAEAVKQTLSQVLSLLKEKQLKAKEEEALFAAHL